jgi:hypothetical protein
VTVVIESEVDKKRRGGSRKLVNFLRKFFALLMDQLCVAVSPILRKTCSLQRTNSCNWQKKNLRKRGMVRVISKSVANVTTS